jgi:hypothetical protein
VPKEGWIVVYLMILYQPQQLFSIELYERMIAFGENERIEEEAVVAYCKVLSWYSPLGTEKTINNFSRGSLKSGPYSNRKLSDYDISEVEFTLVFGMRVVINFYFCFNLYGLSPLACFSLKLTSETFELCR